MKIKNVKKIPIYPNSDYKNKSKNLNITTPCRCLAEHYLYRTAEQLSSPTGTGKAVPERVHFTFLKSLFFASNDNLYTLKTVGESRTSKGPLDGLSILYVTDE